MVPALLVYGVVLAHAGGRFVAFENFVPDRFRGADLQGRRAGYLAAQADILHRVVHHEAPGV
jgi:hypothetical protein